jgi:hypothetical protein
MKLALGQMPCFESAAQTQKLTVYAAVPTMSNTKCAQDILIHRSAGRGKLSSLTESEWRTHLGGKVDIKSSKQVSLSCKALWKLVLPGDIETMGSRREEARMTCYTCKRRRAYVCSFLDLDTKTLVTNDCVPTTGTEHHVI